MGLVLETAKWCWRDNTGDTAMKLQYVDDGLVSHMFMVDGRLFAETEYGLYVSNSQNDAELVSAIKSLAQAAIQNDKARLTDVISIYRDTSISSMAKKLQHAETERDAREDAQQQANLAAAQKQSEALAKIEQMKMEQEERIEMRKLQTQIILKQMEMMN
jgi:hypothetical protein